MKTKNKYRKEKIRKRKRSSSKPQITESNTGDNAENEDSQESGVEDLLVGEINNEEDISDDEVRDQSISDSDEEDDKPIFDSDVESQSELSESDNSANDSSEDVKSDDESSDEEFNNKKAINQDVLNSKNTRQRNNSNNILQSKAKNIIIDKESIINKKKVGIKENAKKCSVKKKVHNDKSGKKNLSKLSDSDEKNNSASTKESSNVPHNAVDVNDEYEYDSSDEEDIRNTIGNIPIKWYDSSDHIGYDWDGKKILKPKKGDQLDNFLKRMEDPDFWRTVKDNQTGQDIILTEEDIELITRIQKQRIPDAQYDEYAPWIEWFTSEVEKMPLRNFPEHKRSFLPSKSEAKQVSKLVHALKMGWIKSREQVRKEREEKETESQFYMLWQTDDQAEEMRRIHNHIPAPKRFLPGHAESYNPPPEYLFDNKELKMWNKLKDTPWKRKLHFIPQKYESLRHVPAYPRYIKERFQRCLDLYLCPRALKMKLTIEPEELVPQLPSPKDLQPFPTFQYMVYKGHTDMIRSMSIEPEGHYLATGAEDETLRLWEIETGRCLRVINCGGVIRSVAWCPNQAISLIAVAVEDQVFLINPRLGDHVISSKTDKLLEIIPQSDTIVNERVKTAIQWEQQSQKDNPDNWDKGIRLVLKHFKLVYQVTWHPKGDYFATVMPQGQNRSVLIHQLSKRRSQLPFSKSKGLVQCVLFHPIRPFLFVATQRNVRIYDLVKQEMVKKLLSNSQWISSMAIHPGGDNLLVGTHDRKVLWFDLDLSTKPYQTLRLHGYGVRGVVYHKRYPLFASGGDDRGLIISHGMVYSDLLQNPLIVPLKRLSNHESYKDFGILDVLFHPIQPWVFSAGADASIRLYI